MLKIIAWLFWPTEALQDGEFDFSQDVRGVERIRDGHTYIGYTDKKGEFKNFDFRCSLPTHNRMLQQFRAKLAARESKP